LKKQEAMGGFLLQVYNTWGSFSFLSLRNTLYHSFLCTWGLGLYCLCSAPGYRI